MYDYGMKKLLNSKRSCSKPIIEIRVYDKRDRQSYGFENRNERGSRERKSNIATQHNNVINNFYARTSILQYNREGGRDNRLEARHRNIDRLVMN